MPVWLKEKLFLRSLLTKRLRKISPRFAGDKKIAFAEHHFSHAASAFFPSPFEEAVVLTIDGVGEWATSSLALGSGNQLEILREIHFPHSLGLLYSAFTYYTGFKVNSDEYNSWVWRPYGRAQLRRHHQGQVDPHPRGRLVPSRYDVLRLLHWPQDDQPRFAELFGGPPRKPERPSRKREMDLAPFDPGRDRGSDAEDRALRPRGDRKRNLCLAGGVALNCVAERQDRTSRSLRRRLDSARRGRRRRRARRGALRVVQGPGNKRKTDGRRDSDEGLASSARLRSRAGEEVPRPELAALREMPDPERNAMLAKALAEEKVVGMLQGRMEFGPRALGGRSIIADARSVKMQSYLNLATKFRESFRPFAPDRPQGGRSRVLRGRARVALHADGRPGAQGALLPAAPTKTEKGEPLGSEEWVNTPRSDVPAVTHVDYSARIQTVDRRSATRGCTGCCRPSRRMTGYGILVKHELQRPRASRSSARRKTPTAASCAPGSTSWCSTTLSFTRRTSPSGKRPRTGRKQFGLDEVSPQASRRARRAH